MRHTAAMEQKATECRNIADVIRAAVKAHVLEVRRYSFYLFYYLSVFINPEPHSLYAVLFLKLKVQRLV